MSRTSLTRGCDCLPKCALDLKFLTKVRCGLQEDHPSTEGPNADVETQKEVRGRMRNWSVQSPVKGSLKKTTHT